MKGMKRTVAALLFLLPILMGAACDQNTPSPSDSNENSIADNSETMSDTVAIKIGSRNFTGTLLDNPTATAFKTKLPMTINMSELNGNEKFFDLPGNLSAAATNPGTIQAGDLMLYGSNTLVLFYKTFSTSYRYTRIGRIDNPSGLAAALGSGSVSVTFERVVN